MTTTTRNSSFMYQAPTGGNLLAENFILPGQKGSEAKITMTDLTQRALQAMALGGYVRVLNHTGALAGWSCGRIPVETVPGVYVFVKHPQYNLWAQYIDTMRGGLANSTPADRRCAKPNLFDLPGGYDTMSNQSNVQARLRTTIRHPACYLVEILDAGNNVRLAVARNEINVLA